MLEVNAWGQEIVSIGWQAQSGLEATGVDVDTCCVATKFLKYTSSNPALRTLVKYSKVRVVTPHYDNKIWM